MKLIRDLLERMRSLLFHGREERELAEELQFHLEMESEKQRGAGVSDDEARRRGRLALGGIERTKEDVRDARGTRLVEDGVSDVRYAIRTLRQSPGFTLAAILTLALGIGGTTAVFSAVDAVLLQPLPYQQPGQLVRLYDNNDRRGDHRNFVSPVLFLDYRSRMSSFEATAALFTYSERGGDIGTGDGVRRIRVLPVSADYFDVTRVHPAIGRGFRREEEDGSASIILSHALFEQQFRGDANAIGRVLTMDGKPYTVAGVMPPEFSDPVVGAVDAWVPCDLSEGKDLSNVDNHYISVVARLRSGVTIESAQAELDMLNATLQRQYPDARDSGGRLYPLKEDIVGSSTHALQLMLGAVALVLLLVCVNVANLMLVRGSERAREFALRSALGAHRSRLVRQMLIESLTLAIAGDIAGLVVARVAMSAIVALGAGSIPRLATLTLEPRLLLFSLAIASLSAVAFGLAPMLRASRADPSDVLREQSRSATSSGRRVRLRESLAVSQVALAFVLLVGAGLLIASFQRIREVDLGVRADGVLAYELHLPDARYDSLARSRFYELVAERTRTLPGVVSAGGVSKLPATGPFHQWGAQALTGPLVNTKEGNPGAQQRVVSGDYFGTVGIPVLEGRAFDARDDATQPRHILVSRSLARKLFPGVRAIGQHLRAGGRDCEIIGVVGDVGLDAEGRPDDYVYHAHTQFAGDRNWALTQVVRTRGSLDVLQSDVRRMLATLDPQLVAHHPMSLADAIGRGEAQRRFTLRVLATFAGVALALAAIGLFGVLSYGVRLRTREFGIRLALGAERSAIRWSVLRQGLVVTGIGTVIGIVGATVLSRVMASLVFQVSALDTRVMAGAVVLMGLVGGLAAYLPAHRATTVDPREALQ